MEKCLIYNRLSVKKNQRNKKTKNKEKNLKQIDCDWSVTKRLRPIASRRGTRGSTPEFILNTSNAKCAKGVSIRSKAIYPGEDYLTGRYIQLVYIKCLILFNQYNENNHSSTYIFSI